MEFEIFGIPYLKKGNEIHIKKENRGKFTKSAKEAGQSVQEHARSVLNNPDATPLQKKRANFARNAAKWKHKTGGLIQKNGYGGELLDTVSSFIPIYGTYKDAQTFAENPTLGNFGWMALSGIGDVLQLTGLGYGLGSAIKGIKTANTARKTIKAANKTYKAARTLNQKKMLEKGLEGLEANAKWREAGTNLKLSNINLQSTNNQFKEALAKLGIAGAIDGAEITNALQQ